MRLKVKPLSLAGLGLAPLLSQTLVLVFLIFRLTQVLVRSKGSAFLKATMANRTDPAARSIRGTNPQNLVEKIVRSKIYQNTYWKEQCFGLTAETLVDKAMELDHIGGTYGGNRKPTPFMCLVMKMLQIQPEKDIVVEFIKNDDYKLVFLFYLLVSVPPLK